MKAAAFNYHRAASINDAVRLLGEYEEGEARLIAGGQSLVPMLNMRLWRLGALIDINGLSELAEIRPMGDETEMGALVRHATVETSAVIAQRLPLLATMVRHVGDRQVRNRGSIGGSLVQGDPTGEMPLGCLVLGARVRAVGPEGTREIAMEDFYEGSYATSMHPHEMLTDVIFPRHPRYHAFLEFSRRHGDFCVLSVAVVGDLAPNGTWRNIKIGLGGAGETPMLARAAMRLLEGSRLTDEEVFTAADAVLPTIDPVDDIRASAEYRAHLVPIYVRRALHALRTAPDAKSHH